MTSDSLSCAAAVAYEAMDDAAVAYQVTRGCFDERDARHIAQAFADADLLATEEHDAQVAARARAETLAEFKREEVEPFHGHGFTDPGYWRLVGPKHYTPPPPPPTDAEIQRLRGRLARAGRGEQP